MTESKTVFILGAGASKPYGFPLGSELKVMLVNRVRQNQLRQVADFDSQLVTDFKEALQFGSFSTIDELLDVKNRFSDLGKYLIADTLLPLESRTNVFPAKDWYESLFAKINLAENDCIGDQVTFITLNYDRSLEFFLHKAIDYNLREEHVERAHIALTKVRIIHPHGSLGTYPEVPYGGGKPNDASILQDAASSMVIVSALGGSDTRGFIEGRKCLAAADRIVVLGFGYHRVTLMHLFSDMSFENKLVMGTSFGLPPEKVSSVESFFQGQIMLENTDANSLVSNMEFP